MWKLSFFAVVWLVHGTALSTQDVHKNVVEPSDLEERFEKMIDDYMSSLSMAHSLTKSRSKRDLSPGLKSLLIDNKGIYRLQTVTPVSHLCSPALFSQFLDVANDTYAVCASAATNDNAAEVIVGLYKDHEWIPQNRWYVSDPTGIAAFYYNGNIYVLVADSSREGVDLSRINITSKEMVMDHTVYTKYTTSICIWEMKMYGTYHMAIGNSLRQLDPNNFRTEIFIYKWKDTYYDRYATLQAYDVKDIEPFHIHGTAYLAIANFRRGKSDFETDSEIVKYDLDRKTWVSHQKIRTYGATDWEFFTLGFGLEKEFYLAVANKKAHKESGGMSDGTSVIYKFVKDKFVPFQCLPTPNVFSIASWSTDEGFLLALAGFEAVHLYQYDGWNFVFSSAQYTRGSMSSGVNHLVFHSIVRDSKRVPILSVSNPRHPRDNSVYELGFQYSNYLRTWNEKSTEWCLNTMNKIESSSTESVIGLLDDVIFVDQSEPITINGSLFFEKGFETEKLKTPQLKEIVTEEVYDDKMLHNLQALHERLQGISARLEELDKILKNALKIDGNQTVYGRLEFKDVSFDCEEKSCRFDSLHTTKLNGEDIGDWTKNLVFLDGDQTINGPIFAEKIEADSIIVHGMIDGINSNDLVTKVGNHNITAPKTFENLVTATDLKVDGLVDGVEISPMNILLTTSYQDVTGRLTFEDVEASWIDVKGLVNGIDLSKFFKDAVLSDQPAIITGEKTFHNVVVDYLSMIPGATINGIDIMDLWNNAMWTDTVQEIKAPMTFESVTMLKNLEASSGINGIQIPGPRVVDINNPATITEHHIFEQSTKIAQLNVLESINGIGTQKIDGQLPRLDIMLKTGDQIVTGKKTFHTIHLDADSFVSGTVDGVDLSEFKALALQRNPVVDSNRTWEFNNLVIKGSLFAKKIAGHDLEQLYENALKLSDEKIPEITFKEIVHIQDLESHNINGLDIENDLVLLNKDQDLTGQKEFRNIVLEDNSIVLGLVNNINLNFLNETILRIGNQVLKSKVFNRNVKFNKLTVTGSINFVPVSEFATVTRSELLHARELRNVTFNEIEANNLEVTGKVNGIDVEDMMADTMTYNGFEKVTGTKTIKGTIYVDKGDYLTVNTINDINIKELWEDAVLLDVPQNISGTKVFENVATFDNLVFKETIDGVSERDMMNWMLRDKPQVVEGNVVFTSVSAKNMNVKGYINGLNITELDDSIVKVNEPNVIEGPITFENLVISSGNITLSGTIQGVDLSEEAVTKSDPVVITGYKTFNHDLVVNGSVTVEGLVDGVVVDEICKKSLLMNKEQRITHMTIKGDVVLSGGGTVQGKVGGIDLNEFHETAEGLELIVSGKKTFRNLTIEGPVTVTGLFGGIDLFTLNKTYMSLTRDQDIPAQMQFEDVIFEDFLSVDRFSTRNKMVNGEDLSRLKDRILMKSGHQTITALQYFDEIIFHDVFVAGKVNGLDVPSGLMIHNQTNFIQSPKIFAKPVTIHGNLAMQSGKKINNVDVSDWFKKAVLKTGSAYEIDGIKTFGKLNLTDARIEGLLDGLKISQDSLLMTYGDQIITGSKTIEGNVEIRGPLTVNGLINGVNLNYLQNSTLRQDRVNRVTGIKSFSEPLTIKILETPFVDGVNVTALEIKINKQFNFGDAQNRLDEIQGVIEKMEEAMSKQAVLFQYYELFDTISIPTAYNWLYVSGNDCGELLLLTYDSSKGPCSTVVSHNFNNRNSISKTQLKELSFKYAVSIKSLFVWGNTYLFVANQNKYRCIHEKNNEPISSYIYRWNGREFEEFQTIKTPQLDDMVVFSYENVSCVVYFGIDFSELYCSKGKEQEFVGSGRLPTRAVKRAAIIDALDEIILAVVVENYDQTYSYTEKKPVEIFYWNRDRFEFESDNKPIMSTYAQSVALMSHHTEHASNVFLAIAEGRIPRIQNEPRILIYRFDSSIRQFQKYQEIKDYGELDWIVLETGELILFALDTFEDKIKLYQYKGASGFVHIDTVNGVGSTSLHPFIRDTVPNDSVNHYLALAGSRGSKAQPLQGVHSTIILKSKMKGSR